MGSVSSDEGVNSLVTFEGDASILRGTPLSTVFRMGGSIWKNARGTERTYALSREVTELSEFFLIIGLPRASISLSRWHGTTT